MQEKLFHQLKQHYSDYLCQEPGPSRLVNIWNYQNPINLFLSIKVNSQPKRARSVEIVWFNKQTPRLNNWMNQKQDFVTFGTACRQNGVSFRYHHYCSFFIVIRYEYTYCNSMARHRAFNLNSPFNFLENSYFGVRLAVHVEHHTNAKESEGKCKSRKFYFFGSSKQL